MQNNNSELAEFFERAEDIKQDSVEIKQTMVKQVEYTRQKYKFEKETYASLLGLSISGYVKALQRKTISVPSFIRYCYIFGFDVSTAIQHFRWEVQPDPVKELTTLLAGCKPETLNALSSVLAESTEPDLRKQRLSQIVDAIVLDKKNK